MAHPHDSKGQSFFRVMFVQLKERGEVRYRLKMALLEMESDQKGLVSMKRVELKWKRCLVQAQQTILVVH